MTRDDDGRDDDGLGCGCCVATVALVGGLLLAALVLLIVPACSSGGDHVALGRLAASTGGPAAAPPPPPASASVEVYGVAVVPTSWLAADDVPALEAALAEYLDDASAALGGWRQSPGDTTDFALVIVFHDVRGANFWDVSTRTAWLEWPKGAAGKPLAIAFAPLLAQVLVLDRRRELGMTGSAWTAEEIDCATRGRNLQVRLATAHPGDYEP